MSVATPAVLVCKACSRRYKVAAYQSDKVYKCKEDGAVLEESAARLRLEGEPEKQIWEIPVRLGRYVIDGELGRGSMGVVYKGRQEGLRRPVAIKMLLGGNAAGADALNRFDREARAAAKLKHPNIVAIHEIGTYKDSPFFTMDFVEGRNLDKVIEQEGMMPHPKAARLMMTICRAVQHAHEHGIVHRDLKPSNILIDKEGEPHLTDFGLAKDLSNESMLSMTGDIMGTPGYMSPEQAEGNVHDIDARTDVYALGAILYKLLINRAPHSGPTVASTIYAVVNEYAVDPRQIDKKVPQDLAAICMKALENDRERRYGSSAALADDIECFLHGREVTARPLSSREQMSRRMRKHRTAAIVCGSAIAVALTAVVGFFVLRPSYIEVMAENLRAGSPEVQKQTFMTLMADLKGPLDGEGAAVRLTAEYAGAHDDPDVREAILTHVENVNARPEYLPLLRGWLKHEKPPELCVRSIVTLAKNKHREAGPEIRDRLASPDLAIRRAAVRAFIEMPWLGAIGTLGELMADPDVGPEARVAVGRCAGAIDKLSWMTSAGGKPVGSALQKMGEQMAAHNQQIEDISSEFNPAEDPVTQAIHLLSAGGTAERLTACLYLGDKKDKRAVGPLIALIRSGDRAAAPAAAEALAAIGAADRRDELLGLLGDSNVGARLGAVHALGRLGDRTVVQALKDRVPAESDAAVGAALLDAIKRLSS